MLLAALLFAIVQGITEFLPVSSSGHLRVTALLIGTPADGRFTVAVLHVVTATAAILYYRRAYWLAIRNVWKPGLPRGFALRYAAAQIATAGIALPLALGLAHTVVYRWWLSAWLIGAMMVVNAVVLVAAPRGNDFTDEEILPTLSYYTHRYTRGRGGPCHLRNSGTQTKGDNAPMAGPMMANNSVAG